jgi:hypothetical protein
MSTTREQAREMLGELTDNQVETVLSFTETIRKGRAVVSACDPRAAEPIPVGRQRDDHSG